MSSTGAEPGEAADQAYFLALERAFLALRGKATLLSADDWQTAREWRRTGIPIQFVVAVMEQAFERQRERRSKRGISSLRYFRAAVAAAWDERLAHQAGAGAPPPDPGPPAATRLEGLAGAVPSGLRGADELRAAILALGGPLDEIERDLESLERGFLAAWADELPNDEREALEARVERALAVRGGELAGDAAEAVRVTLWRQALRRQSGLPTLSLFSPAALGEPRNDDSGS